MASKIVDLKKSKKQIEAERQALADAFLIAHKHGCIHVCDEERALIEALHWTSFEGREMIYEFARFIRRRHPWVDRRAG